MDDLAELETGASTASFQRFLDSRKELFHNQIDQLQRIVVTQCKLTGTNPLSQEMAAGALSIKIGKRPRDLINPKDVKYMQAVFSIKDAISKKECREMSAQFGVTVTQVRDFFNSQRSRVRKLVRLSREKAARTTAHKGPQDGVGNSDLKNVDLAPLNSVAPDSVASNPVGLITVALKPVDENPVPLNSVGPYSAPVISVDHGSGSVNSAGPSPVPLNSVGPSKVDEAPSCSMRADTLPGIDELDKHFVDNIFSLFRKEETFSGQVKLMEWILQMQTPSVLNWFMIKGGAMILATWLSLAASEEQTSVLLVTLKVFCHLPLHNALPEHMSAILQSVNKLRFYRTPDISNRAMVLLSKWSKMFARSQAMKKPNGTRSSASAKEMLLKQSIGEIMGNELWQPNVCDPGHMLALPSDSSENMRKIESSQAVKLLPATDDPIRKQILGVSASYAKKRRKVQLVDHSGQKTTDKDTLAAKPVAVNQSRPMSADDIQKAKMRALFKQSKYGKNNMSLNGSPATKTELLNKPASSSVNLSHSPVSKVPLQTKIKEQKKPLILHQKLSDQLKDSNGPQQRRDSQEPFGEMCKRFQIPWETPPEVLLGDLWRVGIGENSKEVDVQKNRSHREMEILYCIIQDVPSNPREPWDLEMDYDDTLTPEVPIEQPPDADGAETQASNNEHICKIPASIPSLPQVGTGNGAEPDLELLAALLKNPELVFALTSGRAGNLSSEETVRLLDMIKKGGAGATASSNGSSGKVDGEVEVSLPSPTPSSNPGTTGWRPEFTKNPFSRQSAAMNRVEYTNSGVPNNSKLPDDVMRLPQSQASVPVISQQVLAAVPLSLNQTTAVTPEKQPLYPSHSTSSIIQASGPNIVRSTKNLSVTASLLTNFSAGIGPSGRLEIANSGPTPPGSWTMNAPERSHASFPFSPSIPTPMQAPSKPPQAHHTTEPPHPLTSRLPNGNVGPGTDPWRTRQGITSSSRHEVNQTNYDATFGGPGGPGPLWERNQFMGDEVFESWSPENSPTRTHASMTSRRHYSSGPGISSGWHQMPDNRTRQRYLSRDQNRTDNRRWR